MSWRFRERSSAHALAPFKSKMPSSTKCCDSQKPATPIEKGNENKKPKNNIRIDLLNLYVFDSPYFWLTTIIFMLSISSDSDQPIVFYINRISQKQRP